MTLVVCLSACHSSTYNAGRADAEKALKNGEPMMETYGLTSIRRVNETAVLEEYGVWLWDRGCVVDDISMEHARGVNETTTEWLKKRYGDDIMKKIADETDRRTRLEIDRQSHPIK